MKIMEDLKKSMFEMLESEIKAQKESEKNDKFIQRYNLTFERYYVEGEENFKIRKTLLPGCPIPTGEEYNKLSEKEQKWWLQQILSASYMYTDHLKREEESIKKFYKKIKYSKRKKSGKKIIE